MIDILVKAHNPIGGRRRIEIFLTPPKSHLGVIFELHAYFRNERVSPKELIHGLSIVLDVSYIQYIPDHTDLEAQCVCIEARVYSTKTISKEGIVRIVYSYLDKTVKGFIMDMAIKGRLNTKQEDL